MKWFASIVLFALILLVSSSSASAQTFTCDWIGGQCDVDLFGAGDCNGNIGEAERSFCGQFSETECPNQGGRCNTCTSPNVCRPSQCDDGYVPANGTCPDTGSVCCLEETITPSPSPTELCYRCVDDFSRKYCVAEPQQGGSCGALWTTKKSCTEDCVKASTFDSFTCDKDTETCSVAENGEFTGANAYNNCLTACAVPEAAQTIKIYCDSNGNPSSVPYDGDSPELYTAIGCIPVFSMTEFALFFLPWAIGLGGGFALVMIAFSSFLVMTSAGDPAKLKAGQSLLTAAITGLLLMLFSAYILDFVGILVLGIPGFGI